MSKKTVSLFAAVLAMLLVLTALPLFPPAAEAAKPLWTVPDGYNAHDYNKCAAFLEQTNENGEKNGEILARWTTFIQNDYDVNDPSTWGNDFYIDGGEIVYIYPFEWVSVGGEMRISKITLIYGDSLVGSGDFAGCTELTLFNCYNESLSALDFSGCTSLERVDAAYNELTELDVSGCAALSELWCYENPLGELDVSDCSALTKLYCDNAGLTSLDLSNNTHLRELKCPRNGLSELDITGCSELEMVFCEGNAIPSLDLSGRSSLRWLDCFDNELTNLDISGCTSLEHVYCYNNMITGSLDLSGCSYLYDLECYINRIEQLDLSGCTSLRTLDCRSNCISELDLSDCLHLENLCCFDNLLTEIDLSHNPEIRFELIRAEGGGTVGCSFGYSNEYSGYYWLLSASENPGCSFLGWYAPNGILLVDYPDIEVGEYYGEVLIARFTGGGTLPGDVDSNGGVTISDAILTLRAAMHLIQLSDEQSAAADVSGDGSVTVSDAILVLRIAMGLMD